MQDAVDEKQGVEDKQVIIVPMYMVSASDLYQLIDESREGLKNLVWSQTATLESTKKFVTKQRYSDLCHGIYLGLELAGCIEVRNKPGEWELGYWLGTRFRGQGIMNHAAKRIADLYAGFRDKPVTAHVRLQNAKSKAILEYAGLREVRRDEEWIYLRRDM